VVLEPVTDVQVEPPQPQPVTIATAIPKGDRFDWLVQKVTELGVERLVLLHAERSVVRWKTDRVDRHLERAQRIADEALRQSRRVWRLHIDGPFTAVDVLAKFTVAEPGGRPLAPGDVSVAIGPEGGWSEAELAVAAGRVDLGPTILRTETAVIAASVRCLGHR
jgi:16S rRNA (uracil1498-N3)-methyltransferase